MLADANFYLLADKLLESIKEKYCHNVIVNERQRNTFKSLSKEACT